MVALAAVMAIAVPAEAAPKRRAHAAPPPPPAYADRYGGGEYIGPIRIGDPNVFWPGVVVGGAATGAYFALEKNRTLNIRGDGKNFNTGAFLLTTVGCMSVAPIVAAAFKYNASGRPLTNREAMGLGAGCLIPIIGPLIVDAMFDAHPGWER
ncbi:MAG: hypothetical protein J0H62_06030 [Rhizobiales bacterium]|nr:hypothetical protein [Hyphomicrobiales bacterium]